jgi:Leucine-rich repeat (LRR) protein
MQPVLPQVEWNALQLLYNHTDGPSWTWWNGVNLGKPWNFSIQPNKDYENPCSSTSPWQGIKCTSNCLFVECNIEAIDVRSLNLRGEIPLQMSDLRVLKKFLFSDNRRLSPNSLEHLSTVINSVNFPVLETFSMDNTAQLGRLPVAFCDLKSLTTLVLSKNNIFGTIPDCLGNLRRLEYLVLSSNQLRSTIPSSLGNLTSISVIDLSMNQIYGSLPESLSNLHNLTIISIHNTELQSTIPESYYSQLQNLKVLNLFNTLMFGTLSNSIGNLSKLEEMGLFNNQFSGTIPSSIGNLAALSQIGLYGNFLTGTIPKSFGNLLNLLGMAVSFNKLTGTIPPELFPVGSSLIVVYAAENLLTGPIPTTIGYAPLQVISLSSNYLTGHVPDELCSTTNLADVAVFQNFLTGELHPTCFRVSNMLENVDIGYNYLTGKFPSISSLDSLRQFAIPSNLFSGTLSANSEVQNWKSLSSFNVANNFFVGPLPALSAPILQSLYVNNNGFTGTIPSSFFEFRSLVLFSASINCLHGTLPDAICESLLLSDIELEGLHSAEVCPSRLSLLGHYFSFEGVAGTISDCLFSLPRLSVLHLSGNKFSGTLSSTMIRSSNFSTLDLSFNEFVGTVPFVLWNANFTLLDLSFNHFHGSVESTFAPTSSAIVNLKQNQLSGLIPKLLRTKLYINILEGNMFHCNIRRSDLPHYDPQLNTYSCGSDTINNALYIWFGLFAFLLGVLLSYSALPCSKSSDSILLLNKWWCLVSSDNTSLPRSIHSLMHFLILNRVVRQWWYGCVMLLILSMFVYVGLSSTFGGYTHQYGWILTAVYKEGLTPAVVLLALFLLFMVIFMGIVRNLLLVQKEFDVRINFNPNPNLIPWIKFLKDKRDWASFGMLLVNIGIVMMVNIVFVLSLAESYSLFAHQAISVSLSLFKISWSALVVDFFGHRFSESVVIAISIFNNIIAPYLAVLLSSPKCFSYIVQSPPVLYSTINNLKCRTYALCFTTGCQEVVDCLNIKRSKGQTMQISYTPPFVYSYQCSSSVLSTFSYVFVYRYVFAGLISILWILFGKRLQIECLKRQWWQSLKRVNILIPILWRPIWTEHRQSTGVYDNNTSVFGNDLSRSYRSFLVPLLTDIVILISFGIPIPPLGILIVISMMINITTYVLSLGRLLDMENSFVEGLQSHIRTSIELLGQHFETWAVSMRHGLTMALCVSSFAWSFLLFDTLGSSNGFQSALLIAALTLTLPSVMYCINIWINGRCSTCTRSPHLLEIDSNIEMSQIVHVQVSCIVSSSLVFSPNYHFANYVRIIQF